MGDLTAQLKREHAAIMEALHRVNEKGIGKKEGVQALLGVKKLLLTHLAREDKELYPALQRATANNPELARTIEQFVKEMTDVSEVALAFFAKYENGGTGLSFGADYGALYARLVNRMSREETRLYSIYDRLLGANGAVQKA